MSIAELSIKRPVSTIMLFVSLTVIGGLLVSTLLTLLVIPVVYDLLDRKPDEHYARRGRLHRDSIENAGNAHNEGFDPA